MIDDSEQGVLCSVTRAGRDSYCPRQFRSTSVRRTQTDDCAGANVKTNELMASRNDRLKTELVSVHAP